MQDTAHTDGADQTKELQWSKPRSPRRTFELREGDSVLATLTWTRGFRALAQ
jgi:hypothetical protein